MDGSIADSTVLRMRTQLQRMHHSSSTSQTDGFLEELLKLPAAPVAEQGDDSPPVDASEDSLPSPTAVHPGDDTKSTKNKTAEDEEPTEEGSLSASLPLYYGPAPITSPEPTEPVVEADLNAESAPQIVNADRVVDVSVESAVEVADPNAPTVVAEVVPVDTESPAPTVVQPIDANVASTAKDNTAKATREQRRIKDPREKAETVVQRSPSIDNQPTAKVEQRVDGVAESQEQSALPESQAQAVDQDQADPSTPQVVSKQARDDNRPSRDKWYEKTDRANGDISSAVDRQQELSIEQDKANDPASEVTAASANVQSAPPTNLDATALVPDTVSQIATDTLQIASDVAAAAQANLAQSARTETVTATSAGASADGAGSNRTPMPGGGPAIGAAGSGTRGNSTSGTASASSKESAEEPRELSQQERVRLVQRVARSFSRLGPEGGQVTLKLHPPQLGVLNVSIKIEGQTMTARLQTETSAARDAIIDNLPILRDRLSEQGIEIEKFQVEVGESEEPSTSGGQTGAFNGNGGDSQRNETRSSAEFDYRRAARGSASRPNATSAAIVEPKLQSWTAADRSLDVRA